MGHVDGTLMTSTITPCEIWNIILSHIHYKAFTIVIKVVIGLPGIQIDHEGVWKGCAQGKNTKNPYPNSDNKSKGILEIIHSDICGPTQTTSLRGLFTLFLLSMTTTAKLGYISWKIKMKCLKGSRV